MLVTEKMLHDLGVKNVVAVEPPTLIVNGGAVVARALTYDSLDEVKLANWFRDACAGALLFICEGGTIESDKYVVRLFDFSRWKSDWDEDEFSPLSLYRKERASRVFQPIHDALKVCEDDISKRWRCGITGRLSISRGV